MLAIRSIVALGFCLILPTSRAVDVPSKPRADPFVGFDLPDDWEAKFWGSPEAVTLLEMDLQKLAGLVPTQAGLRFCRCPSCDATEADETLGWSIRKPKVVTCRACGESFPNDKVPASVDKKVPEELVEVVPGLNHRYPYHVPELEKQKAPDEKLFLAARRDYEAREFLSKAALYAALRYRQRPLGPPDPALARVAAVLILRFAQVYPNYALHLDQPGRPKFFEPAHQPPPYRRGYATAKWDWSGSLDVPINLAIAYAIVRDDAAIREAGRLLNDPDPARTIEEDLFRGSVRFVLGQPEEVGERALEADRGLLVVARLLADEGLTAEASRRLRDFSDRGFYLDGLWKQGDGPSHRRVVGMLDGWIGRLIPTDGLAQNGRLGGSPLPILALARSAGSTILPGRKFIDPEVRRVGWPGVDAVPEPRKASLLGGAGVARLAVGDGPDALDLELRGMGQFGDPRSRRQALRLSVGGRPVLGDLDDLPPRSDGWDLASSSHNTVLVDGLNHRETPRALREPAPGGDFAFFAADPDFQVAVLDDPRAYPRSTSWYRQTVVACSGSKSRYAVSVFEVAGGHQHDQVFHASHGNLATWETSVATRPGPESLLSPSIAYLEKARAEDGRWFVQGYGEFARLSHGSADAPSRASLVEPGGSGVRLHLLGDGPLAILTGSTPRLRSSGDLGRSALILRRNSVDGAVLDSTFVTVFDPVGAGSGLSKVGRMTSTPGFVVLYLETPDGPEHLVINLRPGLPRSVQLADGRDLTTDAFVVRARRDELMMAGGTVASAAGVAVRQPSYSGQILAAARFPNPESRGWFETDAPIPPDPALNGRTLLIRHGDGTGHGWTLERIEPIANNRVRLHVREEPGFLIEGENRNAQYYQFPQTSSIGPHRFTIAMIRR